MKESHSKLWKVEKGGSVEWVQTADRGDVPVIRDGRNKIGRLFGKRKRNPIQIEFEDVPRLSVDGLIDRAGSWSESRREDLRVRALDPEDTFMRKDVIVLEAEYVGRLGTDILGERYVDQESAYDAFSAGWDLLLTIGRTETEILGQNLNTMAYWDAFARMVIHLPLDDGSRGLALGNGAIVPPNDAFPITDFIPYNYGCFGSEYSNAWGAFKLVPDWDNWQGPKNPGRHPIIDCFHGGTDSVFGYHEGAQALNGRIEIDREQLESQEWYSPDFWVVGIRWFDWGSASSVGSWMVTGADIPHWFVRGTPFTHTGSFGAFQARFGYLFTGCSGQSQLVLTAEWDDCVVAFANEAGFGRPAGARGNIRLTKGEVRITSNRIEVPGQFWKDLDPAWNCMEIDFSSIAYGNMFIHCLIETNMSINAGWFKFKNFSPFFFKAVDIIFRDHHWGKEIPLVGGGWMINNSDLEFWSLNGRCDTKPVQVEGRDITMVNSGPDRIVGYLLGDSQGNPPFPVDQVEMWPTFNLRTMENEFPGDPVIGDPVWSEWSECNGGKRYRELIGANPPGSQLPDGMNIGDIEEEECASPPPSDGLAHDIEEVLFVRNVNDMVLGDQILDVYRNKFPEKVITVMDVDIPTGDFIDEAELNDLKAMIDSADQKFQYVGLCWAKPYAAVGIGNVGGQQRSLTNAINNAVEMGFQNPYDQPDNPSFGYEGRNPLIDVGIRVTSMIFSPEVAMNGMRSHQTNPTGDWVVHLANDGGGAPRGNARAEEAYKGQNDPRREGNRYILIDNRTGYPGENPSNEVRDVANLLGMFGSMYKFKGLETCGGAKLFADWVTSHGGTLVGGWDADFVGNLHGQTVIPYAANTGFASMDGTTEEPWIYDTDTNNPSPGNLTDQFVRIRPFTRMIEDGRSLIQSQASSIEEGSWALRICCPVGVPYTSGGGGPVDPPPGDLMKVGSFERDDAIVVGSGINSIENSVEGGPSISTDSSHVPISYDDVHLITSNYNHMMTVDGVLPEVKRIRFVGVQFNGDQDWKFLMNGLQFHQEGALMQITSSGAKEVMTIHPNEEKVELVIDLLEPMDITNVFGKDGDSNAVFMRCVRVEFYA